jgi:signal transduction histidine kinase
MGQAEYKIFIVLATLILFVFIGGIIVFIFQYHRRKLVHEKEKAQINEQHLQELLTTKLEIQKQTMADIGREIHDNIGQRLTLASIYANHLAFENQYPLINGQVSAIGAILNESLADLRRLSKNLTTTNAEFTELKDLIDSECTRINTLNVCRIRYAFTDTNFKISATVKNFILRIIQEFIQNSLKHANCTDISLDFIHTPVGLEVKAFDNGVGFDLNIYHENEKKGIGILNMKKRAELIGARFSFSSIVDKGTTLSLFIPVNKLNASENEPIYSSS